MEERIERQRRYLLDCQLPSGAFRLAPRDGRINPYFAHFACLALVKLEEYAAVKRQLQWYLAHVTSDGYVNDHVLKGDAETDCGQADSEDSYNATFFTLLAAYLRHTHNLAWLKEARGKLRLLLQALLALQQKDGLTWAKRTHRVKYLMDNCEVFCGLNDAAQVFHALGEAGAAREAASAAERCRTGILSLCREEKQGFAVSDETYPRWSRWYPDATSQAFPVVFGVLPPGDLNAVRLYRRLTEHFPRFDRFQTGDPYPWMIMGMFARLMGDEERVQRMLDSADLVYVFGPRQRYWLIHEAGFYIRLLCSLDSSRFQTKR